MDNRTLDIAALQRVCCGNQEAMEWIQIGRDYVHEIDDLIDEDIPKGQGADRVCRIGAMALRLYMHPFFAKHPQALGAAMLVNTINYRDSVKLEKSTVQWQRNYSDWARHGWLDVCKVVAAICGGYDNVANVSLEMLAVAYANHHDDKGEVT